MGLSVWSWEEQIYGWRNAKRIAKEEEGGGGKEAEGILKVGMRKEGPIC